MNRFILLISVILLYPCLASAEEVHKDSIATVPRWTWVTIENQESVKNGDHTFKHGDSCGMPRGVRITALSVTGDTVLAQLSTSGARFDKECPERVTFFIKKAVFAKMTADYDRNDPADSR